LIEDEDFRTVDDRSRELRHLLHAEGKCAELAVAGFAEADIKERFMRALERLVWRQAGELRAQPHERNRRHVGDEAIVLRHVADEGADLAGLRADVEAHHAGGSGGWGPEAEQGADERALPCSVRSEQANGAAAELEIEPAQDL